MKENPYSALVSIMKEAGQSSGPSGPVHLLLGKVLSVEPLKVDVAGTPQEADRFYISKRLLKGWQETLDLDCTEVTVSGSLTASCPCPDGGHRSSPAALDSGTMRARCAATLAETVLQQDDLVLLLTEDDQTFYLLDKVVRMT